MSRIEKRKYIIGSLLLLLQYYISSSVLLQKNGNTRGLYGWLIAFSEWLRNMYLRNKYDTLDGVKDEDTSGKNRF